jgi:hypothetical protein
MIGVHVLTEFIYCPRAGIVAFEEGRGDSGQEDRPGRLDFVPSYRLREIEDALQRAINWFALQSGLGMVVLLATFFWGRDGDLRVTWAMGGVLIVLVGLVGKNMLRVVRLTYQRLRVLSAVAKEPEFADGKPVWVNWWELRAAGFTVSAADWHMADDEARLSGKPFRVLCRGSLRIPVFRQHHPTDRLYRQHFARIAAYCHLIETSSGKQCPFGIVLRGRSYQCVAIPITEEARRAFWDGMADARRVLRAVSTGLKPPPPRDFTRCEKCPVGKPQVYLAGISDQYAMSQRLQVQTVRGSDRRLYHSKCGDRFREDVSRWTPPHELAFAKGLCEPVDEEEPFPMYRVSVIPEVSPRDRG